MIDFLGSGCDAAEHLGLLPDLERAHYPIPRADALAERVEPVAPTAPAGAHLGAAVAGALALSRVPLYARPASRSKEGS